LESISSSAAASSVLPPTPAIRITAGGR
jgi:hypothetical protein